MELKGDEGINIELEYHQLEAEIAHKASAAFLKHLKRIVVNQGKTGLVVAPSAVDLRGDPLTEIIRLENKFWDWLSSRFSVSYFAQRYNNGLITPIELDDDYKNHLEKYLRVKGTDTPPKDEDLVITWKNEPEYTDLPELKRENLKDIDNLTEFLVRQEYISSEELQKMPQSLVDIIRKVTEEGRREQPEGYETGDLLRDIVKQIAENKLNNKPELNSDSSV